MSVVDFVHEAGSSSGYTCRVVKRTALACAVGKSARCWLSAAMLGPPVLPACASLICSSPSPFVGTHILPPACHMQLLVHLCATLLALLCLSVDWNGSFCHPLCMCSIPNGSTYSFHLTTCSIASVEQTAKVKSETLLNWNTTYKGMF